MKRICFLITVAMISLATFSQSAVKVLDKAVKTIALKDGVKADFKMTGGMGSASGTIVIKGKKFHATTPQATICFDGKTQWTYLKNNDEVSVTNPNESQLQAINPYAFIDIYKQGFNYKMKKGTLSNGKNGYKIFLNADNKKQEIREIYLEVDNQYNPVRVSMRQGKSQWVRIVVNSFRTGKKFDSDHFTFPKAKYPNAVIIDLR